LFQARRSDFSVKSDPHHCAGAKADINSGYDPGQGTLVMRDIQTDWKDWSPIERIAAMLLVVLASFAAGALLYLQT
jgi:hypothetical protein